MSSTSTTQPERDARQQPGRPDRQPRKINEEAAAERANLLAKVKRAAKGDLAFPNGYQIVWAYPAGYSRLRKTDGKLDGPAWLSRCDTHGTTRGAKSAKEARGLGAERTSWCASCKGGKRAADRARASRAAKRDAQQSSADVKRS